MLQRDLTFGNYVDINLICQAMEPPCHPTTRPQQPSPATKETLMHVQPYLNFDGRCDEALEFYKQAIGAKVGMLLRFKEAPDKSMISPGSEEKVMHSAVQVGDSTLLMSDGRCTGKPNFNGIALTISAKTEAEADKLFNGLAEGGQVTMPLAKTFFSPKFGMVADKFGVGWMVLVAD
jgi:PhnB protein